MDRRMIPLMLAGLLCAALLGVMLATAFAPQPAFAAPVQAFGPSAQVSVFDVPNMGFPGITNTPQKITDIGTFEVLDPGSLIEVTHQGRLLLDEISLANGVYIQLRVDDTASPLEFSGLGLLRSNDLDLYVPSTFSGYWENLPAGMHTVSLWAYTSSAGSSARVVIDPGGWASNVVLVKEFTPMGTNYLPSIITD